MQYGMAIDLNKCTGCQTCVTSCKLANNLPKGTRWNTVHTEGGTSADTAGGTYPDCTIQHWPVACQHCAEPACVFVCPSGASYKDDETGIVYADVEICIGCKSCMEACPYDVRTFYEDEPEYALPFAVGNEGVQPHLESTAEKCTMCYNLIEKGENPMCVQACVGYARYFGDLDDPESEIAKLVASRQAVQLHEEYGTKPSVYYLS